MTRATMSGAPPGGIVTMILTGCVGYCASALPVSTSASNRNVMRFMSMSLRLDAALFDHPPPLLLLAFEMRNRFLRGTGDHRHTALLVGLDLVGRRHDFPDVRIERVDDGSRRALGRADHEPGVELVARYAGLRHGRQVGHGGNALRARHRKRAQPAALHIRGLLRDIAERGC